MAENQEFVTISNRDDLNQIINCIADPVAVKDRQHRWVLLNDSYCKFMGYSREELIGKSDYDYFPKYQADLFYKNDDEVFEGGKGNISEEDFTDAKGEVHTIFTKKNLYIDSRGEKYIVAVFTDITERKQWEKRMQALNVDLEWRVRERTAALKASNEVLIQDVAERRKTERALRLSEARLEALWQLNLQNDKTENELISYALYEAVKMTQSTMGYLGFYDEKKQEVTMYEWVKPGEGMQTIHIGSGTIHWSNDPKKPTIYKLDDMKFRGIVIREKKMQIVNDISAIQIPSGHAPIKRYMSIPIMERDKVVAIAGVGNKQTDYDDADVRQLTLLITGTSKIIQRRRAEEALAAEKERLSVTLRSIADGVISTDINGNIVLLNPVAEQLTGWTSSTAEGKHISTVFCTCDETDRKKSDDLVKAVLGAKQIILKPETVILTARDGKERFVSQSCAPIKDMDSGIIGAVLVFRDLTEAKRIEEKLFNADKLDSIGILAGGIAHDFNNLLTGVFGYVQLAESTIDNPEAENPLSEALRVLNRARDLTQQLLTFSKGGEPVKKPLAVGDLLRSNVPFALSGSSARFEFDIAADLWACSADENQCGQVIDNLVINAHQAMPSGGLISIRAHNMVLSNQNSGIPLPDGRYVVIEFKDEGVGIPAENLSKIFDPFFTTKTTGNGLGLTTVYSIIKRHNGFIDVYSKEGQGSTFIIYLPATASPVCETKQPAATDFKGSGRILLMDDQDFVRSAAQKLLNRIGFEVVAVRDGKTAIEEFTRAKSQNTPFPIVILDLTIPGGPGGSSVAAKLFAIDPSVKAIASSGYFHDPVMADPAKFGFKAALRKPYTLAELISVFQSILA